MDKQAFEPGQRVVYMKRGESEYYNTDWRATYLYRTPAGRHAIRIDGRKRISIVRTASLTLQDAHP